MQLDFAFTQTVLLHRVSAEAATLYRSEPARTRASVDSRTSQEIACVASPSGALPSPSRSSAASDCVSRESIGSSSSRDAQETPVGTYRRRSRAA